MGRAVGPELIAQCYKVSDFRMRAGGHRVRASRQVTDSSMSMVPTIPELQEAKNKTPGCEDVSTPGRVQSITNAVAGWVGQILAGRGDELSGSLMSSCNDTEWDPDALGALRDPTNVEWTPDARKSMLQTSDAEEHLPWIQYPRCKATLLVNPY